MMCAWQTVIQKKLFIMTIDSFLKKIKISRDTKCFVISSDENLYLMIIIDSLKLSIKEEFEIIEY